MATESNDAGRARGRVAILSALMAALAPGCGGDGGGGPDASVAVCGPADAPPDGVTVAIPGATVSYGGFTSSPNNDCPPAEGGPTSLTLEGLQTDLAAGQRFSMVLCLPRPAQIEVTGLGAPTTVDLDNDRLVQLIDVNAALADDCRLRRDSAMLPSGTITFAGYCEAGLATAGYALTFDGSVPGVRRCPDGQGGFTEEPVTITLGGAVAVQAL
ncbi:MAG TPA: hypothetical protein VNM90_07965 [Haliangium sp.]|nr:hypothetical protein [Haliangium sp.]